MNTIIMIIVLIAGGNSGGVEVSTIPFSSLRHCEYAKQELRIEFKGNSLAGKAKESNLNMVCVAK